MRELILENKVERDLFKYSHYLYLTETDTHSVSVFSFLGELGRIMPVNQHIQVYLNEDLCEELHSDNPDKIKAYLDEHLVGG
jgi:hypothetical protein